MLLPDLHGLAINVVNRLTAAGVDALHVGAPAFTGYVPPGGNYAFDDLQLIVRDTDLGDADNAMTTGAGAYTRVAWQGSTPVPTGALAVLDHVTPDMAYSDQPNVAGGRWIQIYTTRRHGPLLLVDLASWFGEAVPVDGLAGHLRPPDLELLLWQASQVTNAASDCSNTVTREIEKLCTVAARLSLSAWARVRPKARGYDRDYLDRLEGFRGRIVPYAGNRVPPVAVDRLISPRANVLAGNVTAAALDYGVMYDLRHALEALIAFNQPNPPVPSGVLPSLTGHDRTGERERKIWDSRGNLGIAGFTIHQQVTEAAYAGLTAEQLFDAGHVAAEITNAQQHGYWS